MLHESNKHPSGITQLMQHPIGHGIAVIQAGLLSLQHKHELKIKASEAKRYFLKSTRLALCYSGFANEQTCTEYSGAGKSAFLSCVYDVVTDWRNFATSHKEVFANILKQYASDELGDLAISLYEKDRINALSHDGLERGIVALHFITEMMGTRKAMQDRGIDLENTGLVFQLVDDTLDFEDDKVSGDTNALLSPRVDMYLRQLAETDIEQHFEERSVLRVTIEKAKEKAKHLLNSSNF